MLISLGDFMLICREDLQKVGITTRSCTKAFEKLLESFKNEDGNGKVIVIKLIYSFCYYFLMVCVIVINFGILYNFCILS